MWPYGLVGGEREVATLSEALRLRSSIKGNEWSISETTLERACEKEWAKDIAPLVEGKDVLVSLACGVGRRCSRKSIPAYELCPA